MNRLNQTESATFAILLVWDFFMGSVFVYFALDMRFCCSVESDIKNVKTRKNTVTQVVIEEIDTFSTSSQLYVIIYVVLVDMHA